MKMKCDFCNQEFPAEELETIKGHCTSAATCRSSKSARRARRGLKKTPEEN